MAVLYSKNFTNREFVLRQGCHVTIILEWMLKFEVHLIRIGPGVYFQGVRKISNDNRTDLKLI